MRKFYVMINGKQQGPDTVDQIKSMGCDNTTYVFNNEISSDWKKIEEVADFSTGDSYVQPPNPPAPPIDQKISSGNITNQQPPKTWLVESILVTLFCCLPFGIAGIVNASKVESRFNSGDFEGAKKSSEDAKKWTTTSFWIGLVIGVIYFIAAIAGAGV